MNSTVQTLDPKLAETYNRVMGTQLPSRPSAPPVVTHAAAPAAVPTPAAATVPSPTTSHASTKKGLPWWIYLLVGSIFFVLYTFFWLRMFNINLL